LPKDAVSALYGPELIKRLRRDADHHGTTHYEGCACYLATAAEELARLQREVKKYGSYFLDTAHVVDAFRADDRTELGKALRELGKSFDAITDDRESLENAVVPR
jgi:hypothetical protein